MSARSLVAIADDLSPADLTVVAQAISPTNQGQLKWDIFFPRENVNSVDLHEVSNLDFRPVSDRREWNSPGRLIPDITPDFRDLSIVPVESYYKWAEYEMQKMGEISRRGGAALAQIDGATLVGKVTQLVEANYRRIEVDAFKAWSTGTVVAMNPQTGTTYTTSFGFDVSRLQTAGTAWDNAGLNAYDEFIAWAEDAIDAVGSLQGVVLRMALLRAIQADAPDLIGGVAMTRANLSERISADLGVPFQFVIFEDTVDVFSDGGTAYTSTNVWPAGYLAAIPAGTTIGRTAFAPVLRAMEIARALPGAGIDQRGMTVYYDEDNTGKQLEVQVQANPFTIPNEARVFVINTGVV
jgi:hypothetical protein